LNNYSEKIKVGIIGLGKMGGYHLNAIKALQKGEFESYYKGDYKQVLSRIEVCGLCDISPQKLKHSLDVQLFSDYRELIDSACPDIIIVATPTQTHFDITKFSLEKGANVFVEKPIVVHSKEFAQLLKIAKNKKLNLMAGHIERYNPVSLKLNEILSDHKQSKKTFQFTRIQRHDPRINDDIIIDKLIHDLDLSFFLFGEIKKYRILEHKKKSGRVQELKLWIENNNSAGEIFVSWLKGDNISRGVKLNTEDIFIEGDFLKKTLKINDTFIKCDVPQWIEARNNQVKDEMVDFIVHCFSENKDLPGPLLSMDEISSTVKIIEEISNTLN